MEAPEGLDNGSQPFQWLGKGEKRKVEGEK
jgi:hypothetical protein